MFLFRAKASGVIYGALIDIGSGSVGVAIVRSSASDKLPELIYTHRITMRITKHGGRKDENLRRVREALFSASLLLSQEGYQILKARDPKATISRAYITCSSPWSATIARNVHYENDEPFKITKSIIHDLVESAETEIASQLREQTKLSDEGFEIVERATVDITINDYPITNPYNQKGSMVGLSHVAGLIPREIMAAIHEVQDKLFPGTELRVHTYMLVMYCVIRDLFPRVKSLCIVDITGEATEFGIVENNLLIENSFVPYGSNTFIREVMEETGKPSSDVDSHMRAFGEIGGLESTEFNTQITAYEGKVTEAIKTILNHRTIPADIIITAQRPYEKFFKSIIERAITNATGKAPKIIRIESKIIDEISHGAGDDVYLALGARFFHKLHGCGEIGEV